MRCCTATMGAKNRSFGSPPPVAYAVIRASGARPCARANASDATTSALAPSCPPRRARRVPLPAVGGVRRRPRRARRAGRQPARLGRVAGAGGGGAGGPGDAGRGGGGGRRGGAGGARAEDGAGGVRSRL